MECIDVIELSFAGVCLDTGVRVYEQRAQSKRFAAKKRNRKKEGTVE